MVFDSCENDIFPQNLLLDKWINNEIFKNIFLTVSTLLIVGCGNDKDSESSKSSEQANIEAKKS